ncbi:hypothetical protein SNN91_001540 [Cronobacter sakazakii]|nr:hypothetical protein [Cronobacter sakazakii]
MGTFIPLFIVGLVFLQAALFARAAYLRRMVMYKRVLAYIERDDASLRLKILVASAFEDTLNFKLPLILAKTVRLHAEKDPRMMKAVTECKCDSDEDTSSLPAKAEADKIISLMFSINFFFNKPLYLLAFLKRVHWVFIKRNAPVELYKSSPYDAHYFNDASHQHP